MIENCLLKFITENVLTDATLKELVTKANVYLKSLANRPRANLTPLRSKVASLKKKIDVLVERVTELNPSQEGLREGYERTIRRYQEEINKLRTDLCSAEKANAPVPPQLSLKRLREYLPQLRAVLSQEIPQAAEALRQLTGPISIRQEKILGKTRGARVDRVVFA